MQKLCLLEAGKFLLGIDAAAIIRQVALTSFIAEEQKQERTLIHLESFLSQQPFEIPEEKKGVVVVTDYEPLLLVVDRIPEEIDVPDRFEPLPSLYPELARHCCPQIFVHDNRVILLFDVHKLGSVVAKLETGCGVIFLDELRATKETVVTDRLVDRNRNTKPNIEQPVLKIDNKTFARIVYWVIDEYLKHNSAGPVVINTSKFTMEHKQLMGFGEQEVQKLINRTIQKCDKSHNDDLHRIRNKLVI